MMVYGVDTNVVLRLFVDDEPGQREAALRFGAGIGRDYTVFVTLLTLIELSWALKSQYGFDRRQISLAIRKLLHTRGLVVEGHDKVIKAVRLVERHNADFTDALIACQSLGEGCKTIYTFDIKAARKIPGMELFT
ncbi:PIN domain-containing protein [Agrobacterium cavarae]|uniref:PIN domain-containing protein n=1 Tax=Agrobacterium cavarae TaxID=2528239 RepID=UPI0028AFC7F0|nr:type II toxin-antitoxin system VapC family toxin [Agrobacterium cavarae]